MSPSAPYIDPSSELRPRSPRRGPGWLSRVLGVGEDPLSWSLPIVPIAGVRLRVHVVFILWGLAEILLSMRPDVHGPIHVGSVVAGIVLCVLFREIARAFVGRRLPDRAELSVVWPMGALSSPFGLWPNRKLPLAGIAASAVLQLVLGSAILMLGGRLEHLAINPLNPGAAATELRTPALVIAWWFWYANTIVLLANLLIPMPPLDAGRLVQCYLARRQTPGESAKSAATIGMVVALGLFVLAAAAEETRLIALAALGAVVCWVEYKRAQFVEPVPEAPGESEGWSSDEVQEHLHRVEIDRILGKIASEGMSSLTPDEVEAMQRETSRLQREAQARARRSAEHG